MKKTILEIYALTVCFFAVACFLVTVGIALYDTVQIASPEFTMNRFQHERLQSNEAYRSSPPYAPESSKTREEINSLSDDEVAKRRASELTRALAAERHDGKQSLLKMVIIMLVDSIAFAIHWQLGKRARQSGA